MPNLSALYKDVLLDFVYREKQRAETAQNKARTKQSTEERLEHLKNTTARHQKSVEEAYKWVATDFEKKPMPPWKTLFENFAARMKVAVSREVVPIFYPTTIDGDKQPNENVDTQAETMQERYKNYVSRHTHSLVVEEWTRERDEITFNAPPHQEMENLLLQKANVNNPNYTNTTLNDYNDTKATLDSIGKLYDLFIDAPRSSEMMCFSRTVRNRARLPSAWFKTVTKTDMKNGNCVMLPIFLSTSNLIPTVSSDQHGTSSPEVEYDSYEAPDRWDLPFYIMQIIVPKGMPMLPLFDFRSNEHAHENEVLLPPGIELVYLGTDAAVDGQLVEFYVAQMPE